MTATVVLVHGGWAGSWIWREVSSSLDARGVRNVAVDLPSCSSPGPDVGFKADAAHVRGVIDELDTPVVLAGNSYGGIVITEAAVENPSVKRLVYFAAFMPGEDETVLDVLLGASDADFGALVAMGDDGLSRIDVEGCIGRAMFQAPKAVTDVVRVKLDVPMSFGADVAGPVSGSSWSVTPATYVVCSEDRAIKPDVQREWAKTRATDFVEWASDHCPECSHPDDCADLLAKLV